jgi:soluble lytic murein transglycosylase-like protein
VNVQSIAALGPAAAAQRVQQLQKLIDTVQAGPAGFAATLQAAQTSPTQSYGVGTYTTASSVGPATSLGAPVPASYAPTSPSTVASPTGSTAESQYDAPIAQAAVRNGVDPAVLHGLIQQESGFDPTSTSSAGALGLTQLMPGTASSLGVTDPLDPAQSIEGGARYLGEMLRQFGGNAEDALAAYNAGPGAVQRYGGVPPYSETQQYVTKVLGYAAEYRQSHPAGQPYGVVQPSVASPQAAIA